MIIILITSAALLSANKKRTPYERVIIIGVDGAGSFFKDVDAPYFNSIFEPENVTYSMKVVFPSLSAQCWGSMMYGVLPDTHGLSNDRVENVRPSEDLHSFFYYAHQQYPDEPIASIVGWSPINYGIVDGFDGMYLYPNKVLGKSLTNDEVVKAVIDYFSQNDPKLLYIQFDDVDHAGHSKGWCSPEYYKVLTDTDKDIGTIYEYLRDNEKLDGTLFIVTADHGGKDNNHGGDTLEEMRAVFAVAGRGLDDNNNVGDMCIIDIPAIVYYALGIENGGLTERNVPTGIFGK